MPAPVGLNEVAQKLLDPHKWAKLRAFAPNDILALTYLNAPYPDQDNPSDFFWGGEGSFEDALHCHRIGRELNDQCRSLMIERKLVAYGSTSGGVREMITPLEWVNLWPMFASNRATGPNASFDDIEIVECFCTPDQKLLSRCLSWFGVQTPEVLGQKKVALLHQARMELGTNLTNAVFNVAYKAALGRTRGRPRKQAKNI